MKTPHRTITILAFSLMALNAILLAFGAVAFDQPSLLLPAAVCAAAAGGVYWAWRWHRRNSADLEAARPELRRELEELRQLLRSPKS